MIIKVTILLECIRILTYNYVYLHARSHELYIHKYLLTECQLLEYIPINFCMSGHGKRLNKFLCMVQVYNYDYHEYHDINKNCYSYHVYVQYCYYSVTVSNLESL